MMSTVLLTALMWAGPAAAAHSVAAEAVVDLQRLDVVLTPAAHSVSVRSRLHVTGPGVLRFDLTDRAEIESLQIDGRAADHGRAGGRAAGPIEVTVGEGRSILSVRYRARLEEDVASGERPGQIHNFAVQAHVGEDGVFLSDGSAWHPRPLGPDGRPALHQITVDVAPLGDWSIVAAGDPVGDAALDQPCWRWSTPRPVDGMAIVGNRHRIQGIVHETAEGPVEIVMHVPDAHARLAPMFLEAAAGYLDLYVPRLGRFPYRRFSIVENFFSSGFAFPGFTVLGPQVVGMAPRSLAPGYLDHELLHCWWGNGVYVDSRDGNWCEALTSYGANYFRRVAEEGAEAGRAYRRGILMKLSTDPATLDDGPLGAFGSADPSTPGPDRFVGWAGSTATSNTGCASTTCRARSRRRSARGCPRRSSPSCPPRRGRSWRSSARPTRSTSRSIRRSGSTASSRRASWCRRSRAPRVPADSTSSPRASVRRSPRCSRSSRPIPVERTSC
jgi:hypothetical protein